MAHRFIGRARTRHPGCPESGDYASWICLMQHYGLPTRLLDWSGSPLVAVFFALFDVMRDEDPERYSRLDAAVWMLSPIRLNTCEAGDPRLPLITESPATALIAPAFTGDTSSSQVLAVQAAEVDLRMFAQQGMFTVHGSRGSLEQQPLAGHYLHKLVIPAAYKERFAEQVRTLGVRRADLFPDLGTLAADIKRSEFESDRR